MSENESDWPRRVAEEMNERPRVLIECPHVLTFSVGYTVTCAMCHRSWREATKPKFAALMSITLWGRFKTWVRGTKRKNL